MKLTGLIRAKFIRRYKRFFIDAELANGEVVVAHCPNTGSMKSLLEEAKEVWIRYEDNPKRKLKYTAEILELQSGALALINTQRPNAIVEEALALGQVEFLRPYTTWKLEVKYGSENSKIDVWSEKDGVEVFVEIKNMTLMDQPGWGSFPDAVTTRGQKHLRELAQIASSGLHQAVLCFLVSRNDVSSYGVASHIDSEYEILFEEALNKGVCVWAPKVEYQIQDQEILDEKGNTVVDVVMALGESLNYEPRTKG